ncbi:hypothetical protein GCM10012286_33650 [Streptomyces lasiicapitis]|uniref:Uncharacterized protein n=1 Tax=Streptomyces lasiicapitis TaxID=1923961 RepID=A0ABQ2M0P3_9ACTN|nr:hypothetical protein GCM10012286_33650 [Streptomyces lasiicapitis]
MRATCRTGRQRGQVGAGVPYWTVLRDQRWERIWKANPAIAARYDNPVQAMRVDKGFDRNPAY